MKNNLNKIKKKNISKRKENGKSNIHENKIDEIKIKVKTRKDIKKILLPMRKENLGSYKQKKLFKKNNPNFGSQKDYTRAENNKDITRKLIFLNQQPINENKLGSYINTDRSDVRSFNKKKKLLKISTNEEIFKNHKRKIDKNILRPNKKCYMNNDIDSLKRNFSFKKENSLNNDEKGLEIIEKFSDNFRNNIFIVT